MYFLSIVWVASSQLWSKHIEEDFRLKKKICLLFWMIGINVCCPTYDTQEVSKISFQCFHVIYTTHLTFDRKFKFYHWKAKVQLVVFLEMTGSLYFQESDCQAWNISDHFRLIIIIYSKWARIFSICLLLKFMLTNPATILMFDLTSQKGFWISFLLLAMLNIRIVCLKDNLQFSTLLRTPWMFLH